MKKKLFIPLLLVTLVTLILLFGCGGDNNGVTSLSSTNTPTPAIPTPEGNVGYVTIKVVWPQSGIQGKCIISSKGDEKDLIASMPVDATHINVTIRDANQENPDIALAYGRCRFDWVPGKPSDQKTLGPLPVINVKIRAEAYNIPEDTNPISVTEKEYQINAGNPPYDNTVDLALGDYSIDLKQTEPTPIDICDTVINTTLFIVYPTPAGTLAPSPKPVGNRKIKFTVESVTYTGLQPNVTVTPEDIILDPVKLQLNENGAGNVMVTANIKPVKATIKATLVGLDGQDTLISKPCDVYLGKFYFWTCLSPGLIPQEKVLRKYDSNGNQLTAFIDIGDDPNQLRYPSSLAIDSSGNFYIADLMKSSVKKFDSNGNYVNILYNGNVSDICTDSKDNVYVSVNPDNEIRKYDSNGTFLTSFRSEEGGMFQPNGIDCDSELSGNNIYVFYSGDCIVKFDCNGNRITSWYTNGGFYGDAIIVDKIRKYIYVACFYPVSEIQKFDLDGNFLSRFAIGDGNGRLGVALTY